MQSIELWNVGTTAAAVLQLFTNLGANWLSAHAMNVSGLPAPANGGRRCGMQVHQNSLEVGLEYHGWSNQDNNYLFFLTHLAPAGVNCIGMPALQAISNLFDG